MRHVLRPGGFPRRSSIVAAAAVLSVAVAVPATLGNSDVGLSYEASFLALSSG